MGPPASMRWSPPRRLTAVAALLALLALPTLPLLAAPPAVAAGPLTLHRLSPRPPAHRRAARKPIPPPGARPQLAYTGLDVRLVALLGAALLGAGIVLGAGVAHDRRR